MKKIPYGISDYKDLQGSDLLYVDKTKYLEKLEQRGKTLIYLRPGRFGKSLFTSMMFYYYDINSKDNFEKLFKNTCVHQNPTPNKNNYYVLKFDFSGLTTDSKNKKELESEFKGCVRTGIINFCDQYNLKYNVDENKSISLIIKYFLSYFKGLKLDHKLYILVDEYDNFTNAILEGDAERFKSAVGNGGFVKAFYAVLKEYVGLGVIERFFATGICPITLNSMTTGFNIATDLSREYLFNEMIGLTHDEVKSLIKEIVKKEEQEKVYNLMIEHYNGYLFNKNAKERIFNATLVMYFLDYYENYGSIPEELYDANIVVNYDKIDNLLKLQNNTIYLDVINEILKKEKISSKIIDKFNLNEDVKRITLVNLLYYFGCLTVLEYDEIAEEIVFTIPNKVMKNTYHEYFLSEITKYIDIDTDIIKEARAEIFYEGKINKLSEYISDYLTRLGSRMFLKFDEKYIQLLYGILLKHSYLEIKSEYPIGMGYVDLMIFSKDEKKAHYNIMIEFKYIKKNEFNESLFKEKIEEGTNQLKSYNLEVNNLKKYLVVFVGNECLKLTEV